MVQKGGERLAQLGAGLSFQPLARVLGLGSCVPFLRGAAVIEIQDAGYWVRDHSQTESGFVSGLNGTSSMTDLFSPRKVSA